MEAVSTELLAHLFRLQSASGCFSSPAPGRRCWHRQQGAGHQPEVKKRGFISGLSLWSLSRQTGARKGASGNKALSWHWSDVSPGLLDRAVPHTVGSTGRGRTAPTQRLASSDLSLLSLSQEREGPKARSVGMMLFEFAVCKEVGEMPLDVITKQAQVYRSMLCKLPAALRAKMRAQIQILAHEMKFNTCCFQKWQK